MHPILSIHEFELVLAENDAVLAYFSTEVCSVCKVLKPKVAALIANEFPKMKMIFVESDKIPVLAAQSRVFVAPTVVVFFAGRETIRKSRAFGIEELGAEIRRPYSLIFE